MDLVWILFASWYLCFFPCLSVQKTGNNKSCLIVIAQGTAGGERIFTQLNWDTFPQVFYSHWRESASQDNWETLNNAPCLTSSLVYNSEKNSNSGEKRLSLQPIQRKQESHGVLMKVPKQYLESPQFCLCLFHKIVADKKKAGASAGSPFTSSRAGG